MEVGNDKVITKLDFSDILLLSNSCLDLLTEDLCMIICAAAVVCFTGLEHIAVC